MTAYQTPKGQRKTMMTSRERFAAGAAGGLSVLIGNLVLADSHSISTHTGPTLLALYGLVLRNMLICVVSGLRTWAQPNTSTRNHLFKMGATATIAFVAVVNGNAVRTLTDRSVPATPFFVAALYGSQQIETFETPQETGLQQFVRGFFNIPPDLDEYFVWVGDATGRTNALARQTQLMDQYPDLDIRVFRACTEQVEECDRYVLTVGLQVGSDEAQRLQHDAHAVGLAGAEIRHVRQFQQ